MRISVSSLAALALFAASTAVSAQTYKVEEIEAAPPSEIAPEIAETLDAKAYRISEEGGGPLAEIWLRKAVPASEKPAAAKGAILFPFLAEGELLGAVRLLDEAGDYRDQAIDEGVYTIRYGLLPVNGDHLGVSPFRDYALLLPAKTDKGAAKLSKKKLEDESMEAAGTSHPAIFSMLAAPVDAKVSMSHDEEKDAWSVALPLNLTVPGEPELIRHPVSLIVLGFSDAA